MDWSLVIDRNRDALLRIVAVWAALLGSAPKGMLTRRTYFAVLRVLRSAESAVRRLVMIEARELAQRAFAKRAAPKGPIPKGTGQGARIAPFPLFDPRKTFESHGRRYAVAPRIGFFDDAAGLGRQEAQARPTADDLIDGSLLSRRLVSLKAALEDLPKQAKRLRRAQARRSTGPKRLMGPMRPGWPPGYRKRGSDEIDEILRDCQTLARWAVEPVDTG